MAGKITALVVQKRNRERVNVYLDGKFAFGLADIEAVRLKRGQYLSDDDIARLKECDTFQKTYGRVLNLLSYRPRSEAEVRRYLRKRGEPEAVADEIVARLTRAGLLDDEEFARYWVENREQFRPRGAFALRSELRQKGIHEEIIQTVLDGLDEEASAYRVASRQGRRLVGLEKQPFRRRLGAHLQRRGFEYAVIYVVVERVWQEMRREEEDREE